MKRSEQINNDLSSSRDVSTGDQRFLLLLILISAAAIRIYGINHDLPFVYDQDEPMFVGHALTMLKNHDPNPHWFGAPAGPTMYLLAALFAIIFGIGRILGLFHSSDDFKNLFYSNPSVFYLSGRIVSLLFALASIWLVYKIGRRLFGPAAGFLAAAVLTLSPIHIVFSQQVRMDMQMTLLLLAALWFCLNILERGAWTSYILAGLFTGLACVTKYPAVVFTLTIAFSHFLAKPSLRLKDHQKLLGSAAATVMGAFVGAPYVFLDFRSVLRDVAQEARPEHLGATGEGLVRNFIWYVHGPLPEAISFVGLLLVACGMISCIASKQKSQWVLVSFPLLFLIFISSLSLRWERWTLPAVPFLCLLIAAGAKSLFKYFSARIDFRITTAIATIIVCLIFGPLAHRALIHARTISSPFTSTLARQWLIQNIPPGSRVLTEVYGPLLPPGLFKVFTVDQAGNLVRAERIVGESAPQWDIGRIKDPTELESEDIDYVVISDRDRYLPQSNRYAEEIRNYERIINSGRLALELRGDGDSGRGPGIQIVELPKR